MFGEKDIDFITRGMDKLGTAIFSNDSKSILRLPTSIIKLAGVDTGLIWFTISNPYEDMNGLDQIFPAQLQFYRKYFDYHIVAYGEATIILDGNECKGIGSTYIPPTRSRRDILIRFKVVKAEYFDRRNRLVSVIQSPPAPLLGLHKRQAGFLPLLLSPFAQ
jgi:hypothetical protein